MEGGFIIAEVSQSGVFGTRQFLRGSRIRIVKYSKLAL